MTRDSYRLGGCPYAPPIATYSTLLNESQDTGSPILNVYHLILSALNNTTNPTEVLRREEKKKNNPFPFMSQTVSNAIQAVRVD